MKKLALVALALVIALPLFAGELDNAVFSLSGDCSLIWGLDTWSVATGFSNTLNAKLRLDFKPEASATSSGSEDGDIYGEIQFDEISIYTKKINNTDDNDADLEMDIDLQYAKIVGPMFWVSIKGSDSAIDYENAMQNGIIGIAAAWDKQMDMVSNTVTSSGGFEVGLNLVDMATVEVSGFSLTDWTATSDENAYGFKASVSLAAVDNLTLEAALNMGFMTDAATTLNDALGVGAKAAYTIALSEDMSIMPEVAMDMVSINGGMNIAIGNGLKFVLAGSEVKSAEDAIQGRLTVGSDTLTSVAWDDGVNSGVTLGWDVYLPSGGTAQLGLQAHVGLSMVENLEVAAGFEAADILNNGDMGFAVFGKYDAGMVIPRAGVFMRLDNEANGGSDGSMIAEAGFELPNILPLTSLYVDWNSGELSADDAGEEPDGGLVKVTVKITF
jgi:hypothetical protein